MFNNKGWNRALGNVTIDNSHRVCSHHFTNSDFKRRREQNVDKTQRDIDNRRYLKRGAIPSIAIPVEKFINEDFYPHFSDHSYSKVTFKPEPFDFSAYPTNADELQGMHGLYVDHLKALDNRLSGVLKDNHSLVESNLKLHEELRAMKDKLVSLAEENAIQNKQLCQSRPPMIIKTEIKDEPYSKDDDILDVLKSAAEYYIP